MRKVVTWLLCICMLFFNGGYASMAAEPDSAHQTTEIETATDGDAVSALSLADAEIPVYEQGTINFVYVDKPELQTPDTEKVLAGLGDGTAAIDSAVLTYVNTTTKERYETAAEYMDEESALFSMNFDGNDQDGVYTLESICYTVGGHTYKVTLSEAEVAANFGVNCSVDTNPDGTVESEDASSEAEGVVITDADGNVISSQDFEETVIAASDGRVGRSANGNLVVVLDPGHGYKGGAGSHATWNGVTYEERDINLKIAQYCKAVLDKYTGLTVYMTRNDNQNGLNLSAAPGEKIGEIVKYAQSVNADILVSIHINSAGDSSAHGAEVYYPNSNYNASAYQQGKGLSELVMKKLTALGLASRGAKIKNSGDGTKYPDGSLADYYGIVRQSKLCGFPGIIIEHAFVSNQSDATTFFGSEAALQKLGEADAQAIVEYFGLKAGQDAYKDGDAAVSIVKNNGTTRYTMAAGGVSGADGLVFQVRCEQNGKTNEYGSFLAGDGRWYSDFNIDDFMSNGLTVCGTYTVTAYAQAGGSRYKVGSGSVDVPQPQVSAYDADGQNTFILIANKLLNESQVRSVRFGVWNQGLSDLHWYTAQKYPDGRWMAFMSVADYKKAGTYYTDAYATYADGSERKIGSSAFAVDNVSTEGIVVENENQNAGTFDIVIKGVTAKSGVASVRVPVWTAHDLSDLYWYDAQRQADGSYVVHADIKNHQYHYGTYAMQSYVRGQNGIENITYSYCYGLKKPTASISSYNADPDKSFILIAQNIPGGSSVVGVKYGVWKDGLSDLHWYGAFKDGLGRWLGVVGVSDYYKTGNYYCDAYATMSDGRLVKIGSTSFSVTKPKADLSVQHENPDTGTFDVIVSNINCPSGVTSIRMPVWTASDLSDLYYYDAQRQSDGTYKITVDIKNHQGHEGIYAIQAYINAGNGINNTLAASLCYRYVKQRELYEISGTAGTSVAQMVKYYNANATYPEFYQNSDAPTIEDFCRIYSEECAAEGIKTEVAFCQAMKETGFLKFGGAVDIAQYNFAGIGATDSGAVPATFGSVREGIRAQVQHLKAYAGTGSLANACVDPRFSLVSRGTARYVEWLGIKENPNGKGWASATGYGYSLRKDYIDKLLAK